MFSQIFDTTNCSAMFEETIDFGHQACLCRQFGFERFNKTFFYLIKIDTAIPVSCSVVNTVLNIGVLG